MILKHRIALYTRKPLLAVLWRQTGSNIRLDAKKVVALFCGSINCSPGLADVGTFFMA